MNSSNATAATTAAAASGKTVPPANRATQRNASALHVDIYEDPDEVEVEVPQGQTKAPGPAVDMFDDYDDAATVQRAGLGAGAGRATIHESSDDDEDDEQYRRVFSCRLLACVCV